MAMTQKRYLIIGGVAGGMSAATRLRRLDENARDHRARARWPCLVRELRTALLPRRRHRERDNLLLQTPASLRSRFNLDVRVRTEVVSIDRASPRQFASATSRPGGVATRPTTRSCFSPGATRRAPHLARAGVPRAHPPHIDDVDAATAELLDSAPLRRTSSSPVAGFIGLEAGRTSYVAACPSPSCSLRPAALAARPRDGGARRSRPLRAARRRRAPPHPDHRAQARCRHPQLRLSSSRADFVLDSRGVRPYTRLASEAGLAVGPTGGSVDDLHNAPATRPSTRSATPSRSATLSTSPPPSSPSRSRQSPRRIAADAICDVAPAVRLPLLGTADRRRLRPHRRHRLAGASSASADRARPSASSHHPASHAAYYPAPSRMSSQLLSIRRPTAPVRSRLRRRASTSAST